MIQTFSIEGQRFDTLPVLEFETFYENLDGEATGRMACPGWPLYRDPQGTIINVKMTVGLCSSSKNTQFQQLISQLKSFGKTDFKTVTFQTPLGPLTQKMYGASFSIKAIRFEKDGVNYWGSLPVHFVAKEAAP